MPQRREIKKIAKSHRTWLDDLGVQETLKSKRMGQEAPGMAGVYGHIMPPWRQRLRAQLQELCEASLRERARLDEPAARGFWTACSRRTAPPGNDLAPVLPQKRTVRSRKARPLSGAGPSSWDFSGVSEGTRTPDTQDHNLVL